MRLLNSLSTGEGKNKRKVWTGYLKKVKLVSKEGTLNLCARHLGLLHDKLDVTVTDERVDVLREMQAKRERIRAVRGSK